MNNEKSNVFNPEFIRYAVELRKKQDVAKIDYWIISGAILLDGDEVLKQKWIDFVKNGILSYYC